jgi:hypothetical protein
MKTKIMLNFLLAKYGITDLSAILRCTHYRLKDFIDHGNTNFFETTIRNKRLCKVFAELAVEDRLKELGYASPDQSDNQ